MIELLQAEDSAPPVSAQMRKETKQSYANLRSLLQKYDKGGRREREGGIKSVLTKQRRRQHITSIVYMKYT